ncbi:MULTISPECIES: DUF58 domain-containing protein [Cellulomonas]|uniref:DUF58 domain-containing protein n=1 Tax=Cellulomonas TaxID=1707 RepID=UPI001FE4DA98|nr:MULTISPECIES: DUF58 domain-containing protein [Cellulomonas]
MTGQDSSRERRTLESTGTWAATRTRGMTVTRVVETRRGPWASTWFVARRLAERLRRALARTWGAVVRTLTPAGWTVLGAVAMGLVLGPLAGWTAGWVLVVAGAVLLVLSAPFLLGGHDYDVDLVLDKDRAVAGREVTGAVRLVNTGSRPALPVLVDVPVAEGLVEVQVPLLAPGRAHDEPLRVAAHRRGVIDVGPLTLTRSDPVGLLRREVRWPVTRTIHVHPVTTVVPSTSAGVVRDLEGMPSAKVVASDLAFHAIREYQPGDSRRNVHWRSTAKVGRLMVREFEETRRSRLALLLGLAADDFADEDELELAVSVFASLGVQALRDGQDAYVATSEEAPRVTRGSVVSLRTLPTATPRALLDATCTLAAGERATTLEDVASLAAGTCPEMSVAFLVVGSQPGADRLRAAAHALPAGTTVIALRCERDADPGARTLRELTVVTIGALGDLGPLVHRVAAA